MVRKLFAALTSIILLSAVLVRSEISARAQGATGRPTPEPVPINKPVLTRMKTRARVKVNRKRSERRPPNTVSLWVISKPTGAQVFVNDTPRGETDAKGELELRLSPGTQTIRVSHDGYLTSQSEVDVEATREPREVEFVLSLSLSSINIVSDPGEAEVYLDEVYKGSSNESGLLVIERVNPSQPHTLRVRKAGYQQQSLPVTSYSGQISIKLVPDSGKLKVVTEPSEAEIYLNDVYKGTSTADGLLVIEDVNPNQTHSLRAKREGYLQQVISVSPHSSESAIKLQPDPVVLLVKSTTQQVAKGLLVEAFAGYKQLTVDAPDHQEIPRLAETMLQSLQLRSTDLLKRIDPYGQATDVKSAQEMSKLYLQARSWRAGDETLETFARYWTVKYLLAKAGQASSTSERDALRRDAQAALSDLGERNLRNIYLLQDVGWAWLQLNNSLTAEKYFKAALELKPDWAYPYFALGFLSKEAGDREIAKTPKSQRYLQAIESFTRAITLKHDLPRAYAWRCIVYAILKKHDEAKVNGLQAIALDPNSPHAHFALGFAYFQKGKSQYRFARDELNRAIAVDSGELSEQTKTAAKELLAQIARAIK